MGGFLKTRSVYDTTGFCPGTSTVRDLAGPPIISIQAFESQRSRELPVRLCLLGMIEATPIKSHQYDCLNMK